jgi:hypothetical protein
MMKKTVIERACEEIPAFGVSYQQLLTNVRYVPLSFYFAHCALPLCTHCFPLLNSGLAIPPAVAVRSLQVPLALDLPQAESFAHVQHQSGKSWLLAV